MQELLVVWLPPLASFGQAEKPAIDTIVESSEDSLEALLDRDEIATVARGLMQLEQIREQTRLRVLVPRPEPAVDRIQVLSDEAQQFLAEPLIRIPRHRGRARRGARPGLCRRGWQRRG